MNFRPVNTATGPDGCLYIADMYHGIIQESAWTKPDSYIHPQIKRKKMDENINRGRIYRVVHDGYKPGPQPHLLKATNAELVAYLAHPNGWWRDNAQKLLVIRGDQSVVPALKKIASNEKSFGEKLAFWKKGPDAITRLHALWTMEGLGAIDEQALLTTLADDDAEIRKAAIRISESFLKQGNHTVATKLENMKDDKDAGVKIQLALSLRFSKEATASALLKTLQTRDSTQVLLAKVAERSLQEKDQANSELRAITMGMDGEDHDLVYHGASYFKQLCITCHGPEGKGIPSMIAPPLSGSARVNGDKTTLINILLHGLKGPIDGKKYPDQMLSQQAQTDEYIASVLSYVRNAFGNKSKVVFVDEVKDVRAATKDRTTPWTLEELMAMQAVKK
jgi:mono/diheme cytochrome c family protein